MPCDFLVYCWKTCAIVCYAKSTLLALRGSTPNLRYWPQRLKDSATHPPCVEECGWDRHNIEYSTDITYSRWPANKEVNDFLNKFVSSKGNQINKDYRNILRHKYNGSYNKYYPQNETVTVQDGADMGNKLFDASANITNIVDELVKKLKTKRIIPTISEHHLNMSSVEQAEIKWVQDSFQRLNIYFKEPVVQVHRQVLDYSAADSWSYAR